MSIVQVWLILPLLSYYLFDHFVVPLSSDKEAILLVSHPQDRAVGEKEQISPESADKL